MPVGDEDFGFGGKAVAWKHVDQVIAAAAAAVRCFLRDVKTKRDN